MPAVNIVPSDIITNMGEVVDKNSSEYQLISDVIGGKVIAGQNVVLENGVAATGRISLFSSLRFELDNQVTGVQLGQTQVAATLKNAGDYRFTEVVLFDKFPTPGDLTVTTLFPRQSQMSAGIVEPLTACQKSYADTSFADNPPCVPLKRYQVGSSDWDYRLYFTATPMAAYALSGINK